MVVQAGGKLYKRAVAKVAVPEISDGTSGTGESVAAHGNTEWLGGG